MEMNASETEIYDAIREVQAGPAIIRHICIICKEYLSDWDTHEGYAICWSCRRVYFPVPKVEEAKPELARAHYLLSLIPLNPLPITSWLWPIGPDSFLNWYHNKRSARVVLVQER
jgi:hypothetical protein